MFRISMPKGDVALGLVVISWSDATNRKCIAVSSRSHLLRCMYCMMRQPEVQNEFRPRQKGNMKVKAHDKPV
eukprot:11580315-Karenia_brevis.AAC.1